MQIACRFLFMHCCSPPLSCVWSRNLQSLEAQFFTASSMSVLLVLSTCSYELLVALCRRYPLTQNRTYETKAKVLIFQNMFISHVIPLNALLSFRRHKALQEKENCTQAIIFAMVAMSCHLERSEPQLMARPCMAERPTRRCDNRPHHYQSLPREEAFLLTVGACLLAAELCCLQFVKVFIRRTFPL